MCLNCEEFQFSRRIINVRISSDLEIEESTKRRFETLQMAFDVSKVVSFKLSIRSFGRFED